MGSRVGVSQGLSVKMKEILLALLVINVSSQAKIEDERSGRILWVTTTSTTTTVSTTDLCWKAGTTIAACTGRKRRALLTRLELDDDDVNPTRTEALDDHEKLENDEELESSQNEAERQGKFLLYWRTTSLTSTTTTYTGTSTIASLECTPSNFAVRSCG